MFCAATTCPNTRDTESGGAKQLYLLTLVPFPDPRNDSGWDKGLGTISGARVARDEINNRTDLLPGYHIELIVDNIEACSLTEATVGTTNLVRHFVHSPCLPIVGVLGLLCSSHTTLISPLAGHTGMDLIQLSIANSPIFETNSPSFPHLWRVLGVGTVYANAAKALMVELGWRRVAIVYEHDSAYYTHVALYFHKLMQNMSSVEIIFTDALLGKNKFQLNQIVKHIKDQAATVLFAALSDFQSAALLCRLEKEGLIYPAYTWIQVGRRLNRTLDHVSASCTEDDINKAKQGHIHLEIQSAPSNESVVLVSGDTYSEYKNKYNDDLQQVENIYNTNITADHIYSNYMYDEVWAFVLAMNKTLPILQSRNLSIDNYTTGQNVITALIEKQMAKVKFQGASGLIEFNDKRGVYASVEIFSVYNSSEKLIGKCASNQLTRTCDILSLDIDKSSLPNGEPRFVTIVISFPVAILLYVIAGLTLIMTSAILVLLFYYREWPDVKASSPLLSVVMLIGCYFLVFGTIFRTTYGHFLFDDSNGYSTTYNALVALDSFCSSTGLLLIVITIFFKLLRVHHFFSTMTLKLRPMWRTCSMIGLILALSLWVGMTFVTIAIIVPVHPLFHNESKTDGNVLVIYQELVYPRSVDLQRYLYLTAALYMGVFLVLIVYLAIRTRNIKQTEFKDTKKLNLFVALLIVSLVCETALVELLVSMHLYWESIIATSAVSLFVALSVLAILMLPKLIPSMRKPRPHRRPVVRRLSRRKSSTISIKNALANFYFA